MIRSACVLVIAVLVLCGTSFAESSSKYIGIDQCMQCHGKAQPQADQHVNLNEGYIWLNRDKHRNAFTVLAQPWAQKVGKNLGMADPQKEERCLVCHAPLASAGLDRALFEKGVQCEACHGPAKDWLGTHIVAGAKHEDNVKAGMTDLKDPSKRADMCLTCHLGDEANKKSVDHELIAAGHPDLFFDLASFYSRMPAHSKSWGPDNVETLRAWGAGAAAQLGKHMERVALRAKDKLWPEYAEARCEACHHALVPAAESWRQEWGYPGRRPGNIPFTLSRLVVYKHLLAAVSASDASAVESSSKAVFEAMSKLEPDRKGVAAAAKAAQDAADKATQAVLHAQFDAALAAKLFTSVIADRDKIAAEGDRAALQAAWLLQLALAMGKKEGKLSDASKGDAVMKDINDHLDMPSPDDSTRFGNPSNYNAAKFADQLKALGDAVKWK